MDLEIRIAGNDMAEMVTPSISRLKNSAQAPRVLPEELRLVLEELQRAAENAVASKA